MAELKEMEQLITYPSTFYSCMECEWDGGIDECEFDSDYDDFKGIEIPYPICPKCGGGLDC
jgi:hypothetical protein